MTICHPPSQVKEMIRQKISERINMRTSIFVIILLSILSNESYAQSGGRKQHVEDDGYVWYELTQNISQHGADSDSGENIVPVGDYQVMYFNGLFLLFSHNNEGVYTKDGKEVIPLSRQYEHVLPLGKYFQVERDGKMGVCDLSGEEIISPDKRYDNIAYQDVMGFTYEDSNGGFIPIGLKLNDQGQAYSFDVSSLSKSSQPSADYSDASTNDIATTISFDTKENSTLVEIFPYYSYSVISNGNYDLLSISDNIVQKEGYKEHNVVFDFKSNDHFILKHVIVDKSTNDSETKMVFDIKPKEAELTITNDRIDIIFLEDGTEKCIFVFKNENGTAEDKICWGDKFIKGKVYNGKLFHTFKDFIKITKAFCGELQAVMAEAAMEELNNGRPVSKRLNTDIPDFDIKFNRLKKELLRYSWKKKSL